MAHQVYENIVLANKIEDILLTAVDLTSYMTVDTSMTQEAGMKKKINTYKASGDVETLAMGEGNSKDIEASFTTKEYEVETVQGRFQYYDEQAMTDPMVVQTGLEGIAKTMINDFTKKAVKEFEKAPLYVVKSGFAFSDVVDAIAKLNTEKEDGLFLLVGINDLADFRKQLADDLKYNEAFVRTGYVGTVCGVPVIVTKAITNGEIYLASKEAVTLFIKKDTEVEQERDANVRNNKIYIRKVAVVALTDESKVVKLVKEAPKPEPEPEEPVTPPSGN